MGKPATRSMHEMHGCGNSHPDFLIRVHALYVGEQVQKVRQMPAVRAGHTYMICCAFLFFTHRWRVWYLLRRKVALPDRLEPAHDCHLWHGALKRAHCLTTD